MPTAPRPNSLQQAASAVFAVTTVVPLLIFVWTLHRVGSLSLVQSQVGLGLALGIALLGYYIFRRLMGQMSDLIRGLGRVVERGSRTTADSRLAASAQERAPGLIAEYKSPTLAAQAHTAPSASAPRPAPAQPREAAAARLGLWRHEHAPANAHRRSQLESNVGGTVSDANTHIVV